MSDGIMIVMIAVSVLLGAIGLVGLLWAVRSGQFDDHRKLIDTVHFDDEESLQDAAKLQERKRRFRSKKRLPTGRII